MCNGKFLSLLLCTKALKTCCNTRHNLQISSGGFPNLRTQYSAGESSFFWRDSSLCLKSQVGVTSFHKSANNVLVTASNKADELTRRHVLHNSMLAQLFEPLIPTYIYDTQFIQSLAFLFISGLNLQSQFNLDNVTVFNKNEQESTLGQKVNYLNYMLN